MFSFYKKPIAINALAVMLSLLFLGLGLFAPARSESQPRSVLFRYMADLYYAKNIQQVSKYWCKNSRVPMNELQGMELNEKFKEIKGGYMYQPHVDTEVTEGNVCTIKGTGWAYAMGYRCKAQFDAVMRFEEGSWKIQYYVWQGSVPNH